MTLYCARHLPAFRYVIVQFDMTDRMNFAELEVFAFGFPSLSLLFIPFCIYFILFCLVGCLFTYLLTYVLAHPFSALTLLVGRQEGHPACKKTEWSGAGVVICLERGADLHTAQLMPLPLTVSCLSKIQIGFIFLVPAHPGSPGKGPLNVCVYTDIAKFAGHLPHRYGNSRAIWDHTVLPATRQR